MKTKKLILVIFLTFIGAIGAYAPNPLHLLLSRKEMHQMHRRLWFFSLFPYFPI